MVKLNSAQSDLGTRLLEIGGSHPNVSKYSEIAKKKPRGSYYFPAAIWWCLGRSSIMINDYTYIRDLLLNVLFHAISIFWVLLTLYHPRSPTLETRQDRMEKKSFPSYLDMTGCDVSGYDSNVGF